MRKKRETEEMQANAEIYSH